MTRPIHPFPARMAPGLAIDALNLVPEGGRVLDPLVGSGTVVRHAAERGLNAIGIDLDPLAVLLAKVWTTPVESDAVLHLARKAITTAESINSRDVKLPWIAGDEETERFINFWFGEEQRSDLYRIAIVLHDLEGQAVSEEALNSVDVLRVALSRIIVTKDSGASLARDVSHSRPHRVKSRSSFNVFHAFEQSVARISRTLSFSSINGTVAIHPGDARNMKIVPNQSVDAVVTSPPYLNAIDYIRGHKLALVWLGHKISDLRTIRSTSIGAERRINKERACSTDVDSILGNMGMLEQLSVRHARMVHRYADDTHLLMGEIARVLKPNGKATLVVGNSCLRGVFISNADGFKKGG